MDAAISAWLISQLGANVDLTDLTVRYTRLGSARAVAIEVLDERLAGFLEQPSSVNVSSVVSVSFAENIRALERRLALLRSGIPVAPDEDDPDGDGIEGDSGFGVIQLIERPRR